MTAVRPIAALDVPLEQLEADIAVRTLDAARARSNSPSDQLAYALDAWLVTHHDAPLSTNEDYPGWTAGLTATNSNALKETAR